MTTNIHLLGWTKSSYSSNGGESCVEVVFTGDKAFLRDSKYHRDPANNPETQPFIEVPIHLWPTFLDLALGNQPGLVDDALTITLHTDGGATLSDHAGVELTYTPDEWDAFAKGVADGEFDRH